jgi:peptide/nickel transport system permease protein
MIAVQPQLQARPGTAQPRSFARRFMARPAGVAAAVFLLLLVLACVAAPLIAPDNPATQDLTNVLSGPSAHHLLGTDTLGRDVLSRLLYGGRRSLLSVAEGLAVVLALGVPLGLAAGYRGGGADRALSRGAEMVMAVPPIIIILVVLAVIPGSESAAMLVFGLLGAPSMLRVVRGATLKVREEPYVTAGRLCGLSPLQVVRRHVLPRVAGPIIVQASIFAAYALLFETGLAYLGLTASSSTPTWGGMVAEASTVIEQQEWLLIPSGVLIAVTILAFGLVGDAARDAAAMEDAAPARRRRGAVPRAAAGLATAAHAPNGQAAPESRPGAPSVDEDALLSVRGLSVAGQGRSGQTLVVDSVSFDVFPGETVGLVGESGCGKTLTALAVLRLLPGSLAVAGGQAQWAGRDLLQMPDRVFDALRGSALAYVSQEPQASLDPSFTVGSQLAEVIRRHDRVPRSAARARAVALLRQVELPDPDRTARAYPHELSGGMAQRVALALALAGRPDLLIADEPTTALDVTVQAEMLALLRRLALETGMAVLLITHDWGVVADVCDRTIVMYAGQVVERGGVQDLFERPLHPYTLGLLRSHPSLARAGQPITALPGRVALPGAWPTGCRFAPRCGFADDACRAGPIPLTEHGVSRQARCVHTEQLLPDEVNAR